MNIFGVGGPELIAILLIMLVVAGPRRMAQWAYTLGEYTAKLRTMWAQTAQILQKEFDEAGVGIQVPTTPPTRSGIAKMVKDAAKPISQPLQEAVDEVEQDLNTLKETQKELKDVTKATNKTFTSQPVLSTKRVKESANGHGKSSNGKSSSSDLGSWSNQKSSDSNSGLGTWSNHSEPED